jgi:hypothetical protein
VAAEFATGAAPEAAGDAGQQVGWEDITMGLLIIYRMFMNVVGYN